MQNINTRSTSFGTGGRHPYNKAGDGPEAAEIRVISEYLNKVWTGKNIIKMEWDSKSKFNKKKIANMDLFKPPCKVVGVFPRGKLIIIECVNKKGTTIYMISQLGMEGKWNHIKKKHSNFCLHFGILNEDKECITKDIWYFTDSRHFGHFNIYSDLKEVMKRHGSCLLTTALVNKKMLNKDDLRPYQVLTNLDEFKKKIYNKRIKNKPICIFLMEQQHVSGIGAYLRAEILYRAKINPNKVLNSFTLTDIENLYQCIQDQLILSYRCEGLTIKSYTTPEGKRGKCPLQVYNRKTDPYNNPVQKYKDKNGRNIHWVSSVQIN